MRSGCQRGISGGGQIGGLGWLGGGERLKGVIPEVGEPPKSWPELPAPARAPAPPRRLLATTGDDDLPGDLQSLSWLTAVDVPRLQQRASGHVDLGGPSAPHAHPGRRGGEVRWREGGAGEGRRPALPSTTV